MVELEVPKMPQALSPCNSRRRSNDSTSPEFEFWMVRNPSFPQPDLHSADELFSGGVILPLHQLHHQSTTSLDPPPPPPTPQEQEPSQHEPIGSNSTRPGSESGSGPDFSAAISNLSASGFTSSKRWKDIFKKTDKKCSNNSNDDINDNSKEKVQEKVRKKEKRNLAGGGGGGMSVAELNINLWPFRRTRSAGNGGNRPRNSSAATTRKISSAPCSRSNSAGESKSRKYPTSPARGGVHLGRSSPIWQVRRSTTTTAAAGAGGGRSSGSVGKSAEKGTRKDGNESYRKIPATSGAGGGGGAQKGKILSLNVPMCIGYRSQMSCRSDGKSGGGEASAAACGGVNGGGGGGCGHGDGSDAMEGVRGGNLFNIRSLFSKKVY